MARSSTKPDKTTSPRVGKRKKAFPTRFFLLLLISDTHTAMLISPLARKLCTKLGIDPATLRGSGPRGRIMAADVSTPAPRSKGETTKADKVLGITRPQKDGFHVFDDEADMSALAAISMPIAVQCEKLLEKRYSLFDYIVRAVVRACTSFPEWMDADGNVNVLLFEECGKKVAALTNATRKTIYKLSREIAASPLMPEGFAPHIIICDTKTSRERVAEIVAKGTRPAFALVIRGNTPKEGIRAGYEEIGSHILKYTFYAATTMSQQVAGRIAGRLKSLLYNPVTLLLIPN